MSGKTDVVKGRLKEAAGALTGNDKLRAEGKTDQAVGKVKQIADKAVDKRTRKIDEVLAKIAREGRAEGRWSRSRPSVSCRYWSE